MLFGISKWKCLTETTFWQHCTTESERTFSSSILSLPWETEEVAAAVRPGWVGKWRISLSLSLRSEENELADLLTPMEDEGNERLTTWPTTIWPLPLSLPVHAELGLVPEGVILAVCLSAIATLSLLSFKDQTLTEQRHVAIALTSNI